MNRDYEEIDKATDRLADVVANYEIHVESLIYMDAVMAASKRMANRITDLENALDEATETIEEILREATE